MLNIIKTVIRHNLEGRAAGAWMEACDTLGLDLEIEAGTAQGVVAGYAVTMSLVPDGPAVHTEYTIGLDAAHAPEFRLSHIGCAPEELVFDGLVNVSTNDNPAMIDFLGADRHKVIADTLRRWPTASMTNHMAAIGSSGIESDPQNIVASVRHLVSLADVLSPCWTEVALDEVAVFGDLFQSSRTVDQITGRFNQLYRESEVTWTGEILQAGSVGKHGQWAVVLLGSANDPSKLGTESGGRVVAMTMVDPDLKVNPGCIVTFTGWLRNLDAKKRLFRIENATSWTLN